MALSTSELWAKQDQHEGDRKRLFTAVATVVDAATVLYPGSYVDVAPSFVFSHVTYVDVDRRAAKFFDDDDGVRSIIGANRPDPATVTFGFVHADYRDQLDLVDGSFDLLISLYAGFISEQCGRYLRVGGTLLVNPSHGDAALASLDDRFALRGVVHADRGGYRVTDRSLDGYLVPIRDEPVTVERIHELGRGVAYTRSAFAYLFERVR